MTGVQTCALPIYSQYLDVRSPELGYANIEGEALFLSRIPYRKPKQGLGEGNVAFRSVGDKRIKLLNWSRIRTKGFKDMLLDEYPAYEGCENTPYGSIAFSKAFAVHFHDGQQDLYLNELYIGSRKPGDSGFKLENKRMNSVLSISMSSIGLPLS